MTVTQATITDTALSNGSGLAMPPSPHALEVDPAQANVGKPKKSRNAIWVVAGLLLIVVSGLGAYLVAQSFTDETQILVASRAFTVDHQMSPGDLEVRTVPSQVGEFGIPARDLDVYLGFRTTGPIGDGSIVHPDQFADPVSDGGDRVVVGMALQAGQLPQIGLRRGQAVRMVELAGDSFGSGSTTGQASEVGLAEIIRVVELSSQDEYLASILVDATDAPYIANLADQNRVALVLVDVDETPILDDQTIEDNDALDLDDAEIVEGETDPDDSEIESDLSDANTEDSDTELTDSASDSDGT